MPCIRGDYSFARGGQDRAVVVQLDDVQRVLMGTHFQTSVFRQVAQVHDLDVTQTLLIVHLSRTAEDSSDLVGVHSEDTWLKQTYLLDSSRSALSTRKSGRRLENIHKR